MCINNLHSCISQCCKFYQMKQQTMMFSFQFTINKNKINKEIWISYRVSFHCRISGEMCCVQPATTDHTQYSGNELWHGIHSLYGEWQFHVFQKAGMFWQRKIKIIGRSVWDDSSNDFISNLFLIEILYISFSPMV